MARNDSHGYSDCKVGWISEDLAFSASFGEIGEEEEGWEWQSAREPTESATVQLSGFTDDEDRPRDGKGLVAIHC